jgi:hypothetical protein
LCPLCQIEPVIRTSFSPVRAVVNAGLWLDDPDVDAITRLCNDIVATEFDALFDFVIGIVCCCLRLGEGTHENLPM